MSFLEKMYLYPDYEPEYKREKMPNLLGTPERALARAVLEKAVEDCDYKTQRFCRPKLNYSGSPEDALMFILDGRAEFWCTVAGLDYKILKRWAKNKWKELKEKGK